MHTTTTTRYMLLCTIVLGFPLHTYAMKPETVIYSQPNDQQLITLRANLLSIPILQPQKALEVDSTLIIKPVAKHERLGVCYNYAIKKILQLHGIEHNFTMVGCQDWQEILPFFMEINDSKDYKTNDLVVYKEAHKIKHFGLLADPPSMLVESKWGTIKAVFIHKLFNLPANYGTAATIVRLREQYCQKGPDQDSLIDFIRNTMKNSLFRQQILMHNKICLISFADSTDKKQWRHNFYEIIQTLEQMPAISVNLRNESHQTLLIMAAKNNNINLVRCLLAYRARKDLVDIGGRTALWFAQRNKNETIKQLLTQ